MNRRAVDALMVTYYSPSHPRGNMFRKISLIWEIPDKGKCKLCRQTAELVDSHVVPRALHNDIRIGPNSEREATDKLEALHMKAVTVLVALVSLLLLAACATDEKAKVAEETWDCMANAADGAEGFEISMRIMFPTANSLDEAKEQFIYVSQSASLDDLKASRDEFCGPN